MLKARGNNKTLYLLKNPERLLRSVVPYFCPSWGADDLGPPAIIQAVWFSFGRSLGLGGRAGGARGGAGWLQSVGLLGLAGWLLSWLGWLGLLAGGAGQVGWGWLAGLVGWAL